MFYVSRSGRDDWFDTIVSALRALHVPVIDDSESHTPHRPRINTEPQNDLVKRRISPPNLHVARVVASEPIGGAHGFGKVLDELKDKTVKPKTVSLLTNCFIALFIFCFC